MSLLVHGAVLGAVAVRPSIERRARPRPVSITVVSAPARAPTPAPTPAPKTEPRSEPAPKPAAPTAPKTAPKIAPTTAPKIAPPAPAMAPAAPILAGVIVEAGVTALGRPAARPAPNAARAPAAVPREACAEAASKPRPLSRPRDIDYPADARARGVEGRLVLRVTVDETGAVVDAEVTEPVDPAIDAAALEAVRTWRFEPAAACGAPQRATYVLARRFELGA